MKSILGKERIVLVGGSGGVGKTTLAASLGAHYASEGLRVLVLTVDPAKRLAQALGFSGFSADIQKVTLPKESRGELFASMLDTQRYFDKIIARLARDDEQKEKILKNPIYQTMVDSLGGTHEYAAMERLYEFAGDKTYDRIIVDTPPTQNAVDLLSAPQRLADFMDNSVLKWFQGSQPNYLKWFKQGTKVAMKLLQKIFGAEFLAEFTRLMDDLEGMQAGFRKTNLDILELLRSDQTAFLLVTYPSEIRLQESLAFSQTLREKEVSLRGLILNRIEPACPISTDDPLVKEKQQLPQWIDYQNALHQHQLHWIERFQSSFPKTPLLETFSILDCRRRRRTPIQI